VTLEALSRSFGPAMDERTRGALFALIARRHLVLDPTASAGPEAWRPVLAARESDLPARRAPAAATAFAAPRTAEVQRLYDEALSHIGSGRLGLALDRLRDALKHAPDDAVIASTAKRISRWAS
jgi:TolA-binding protein